MTTRLHQKGDAASSALYSACEMYRYALTRSWGPGPRLLYVMLNPSTATEVLNDPTIERCERRARALGYGAFRVTNLFALRSTDPDALYKSTDPVGPENDDAIEAGAEWADDILCAWGTHGAHLGRGAEVERLLRASGQPMLHLGLTAGGYPRHPLYLSYDRQPEPWPESALVL